MVVLLLFGFLSCFGMSVCLFVSYCVLGVCYLVSLVSFSCFECFCLFLWVFCWFWFLCV